MERIAIFSFFLIDLVSTTDYDSFQRRCIRWFPEFSYSSLNVTLTGYQRILKYIEDDIDDGMKDEIQEYISDSLNRNASVSRMFWIVFKYKDGLQTLIYTFIMLAVVKIMIIYMAYRFTKMTEFKKVLGFLKNQAVRVSITLVPVYAFMFLVYYVSRLNSHTRIIDDGINQHNTFLKQVGSDYDALSRSHMAQVKCMARQQLKIKFRGQAFSSEMLTYTMDLRKPITTKLTGSMITQDGATKAFRYCPNVIFSNSSTAENDFRLMLEKYQKYFKKNYEIFDEQLTRDIEDSFDQAHPVFSKALSSIVNLIKTYNDHVLSVPADHVHGFDFFLLIMIFVTFTTLFILGGMTILRIRLRNKYKLWAVRAVPFVLSTFIVAIYCFVIFATLHIFGIVYVKKIAVEQDYKAFRSIPNETINMRGYSLNFNNGQVLSVAEKMNSTILDVFNVIDPTKSLFTIRRQYDNFTDDNLLNTVGTGMKHFFYSISAFEFVKDKNFSNLPNFCKEFEGLAMSARKLTQEMKANNLLNMRFYNYINRKVFKNVIVNLTTDDLYTQNARIFLNHMEAYSLRVNSVFLDPVVKFLYKLLKLVPFHLILVLYSVIAVAMLEEEEKKTKLYELDFNESDDERLDG